MNKIEIIKNFNSILGDFLQQVSPIIGTTYHHYYNQLIKANAILPVQYFIKYVHQSEKPLVKYIESRNEAYFENTDNHKEHVEGTKYGDSALMEIIRLQGIYSQLSKDSKDNVWDILQALLQLSNEYLVYK